MVPSATGVQQRDIFGGLLLSLGIYDMKSNLSSYLNNWYLDDGVIAGDLVDKFRTTFLVEVLVKKIT